MTNGKLISKLVALFFVIIIVTDFYYKYMRYYYSEFVKLTSVKLLIGLILATLIVVAKKIDKKNYMLLGLLFICSAISLLVQEKSTINDNIYLFSQYAFGVIAMLFFFKNHKELEAIYFKKIILGLVLLNFVFILLGFLFNIHVFETYYGERFGYNGIFKSTAIASYFYMVALIYYLISIQKTNLTYLLISVIIVSSVFVGSKTLIAFIGITGIVILGRFVALKQKLVGRSIFYVLYTLIISILGFYSLKLYITLNSTLKNVLLKDGILSTIFSYRDVHLNEALTNIEEHFGALNYLFGGASLVQRLPELAIVDLFISFGFIGLIAYILFVKYNFPKINNNLAISLFLIIGVMIVLRGNFLYYPSVIYIALAIFTVILKDTDKKLI